MSMPRILVVGSPDRLRVFSRFLETLDRSSMFVDCDSDCEHAIPRFCPDLLVYEDGHAEREGPAFIRRLRATSNIPILYIGHGACKPAEALIAGADQVFFGTLDLDDLVASLNALLRRCPRLSDSAPVEIGAFHLVPETHRCTVRGQELRLTAQEFRVLLYMVRNPFRVLTHADLSLAAWDVLQSPAFLRPIILALRKAIEPDPANPVHIVTEFKRGYRFVPIVEAEEATVDSSIAVAA